MTARESKNSDGIKPLEKDSPLAARMRPRTLDEFIGQEHIIGPGRLLRRAIQADQLGSILLYGPPGTGKTTLAQIIANSTRARFLAINAVLAGVKDIRESIETARVVRQEAGQRTILFVDEVHRFNKAQQDALLPHVENGTLILIGATTENPYFEVNKALVSRSRIFQLKRLEADDVRRVVLATLVDSERGYGGRKVEIAREALDHIVAIASGDARSALNALELAVETTPQGEDGVIRIGLAEAEESIQRRAVLYDKDGDSHYDTISAFIKSVRGSDPDASLYWLSKMVYAGEDPRFIFRRMLILASEDVGLADPAALGVVYAAAQAYDYVGLPEGQFHLSQACLYLATAPKSNSAMAYFDALEAVRTEQQDEVPNPLKDGGRDGDDFGHGKGYLYPHAYRDHWVAQQYLPGSLQGKVFYQPGETGYEEAVKARVARNREAQLEAAERTRNEAEDPKNSSVTSKSRHGKASTAWLDRAADRTGEILKLARQEIFRLAGAQRDSLVLDMSGGTGFLTWEACRICSVGGVWTRCENEAGRKAMEDWARHMEILTRPQMVTGAWEVLPKSLAEGSEPPRFDVLLGLDLRWENVSIHGLSSGAFLAEWIQSMSRFAASKARLVIASLNAARSQGFIDLLPKTTDAIFAERIRRLERAWRASLPAGALEALLGEWPGRKEDRNHLAATPPDTGTATEKSIPTPVLTTRDYTVRRHFLPSQVRGWFSPEVAQRPGSLLALFQRELSIQERTALETALLPGLTGSGVDWRQSYDFLRVEYPTR